MIARSLVIRGVASMLVPVCAASAQVKREPPRPDSFRFERPVIPGNAGPNRLSIDVSLLSRAAPFSTTSLVRKSSGGETIPLARGGLEDLRFYDTAGREVPYLMVSAAVPDARWSPGRVLPVASTKSASGFEVDLGRAFRIDRFRLAGIPPPFLKRVRVEGGGDRSRWTLLIPEGTVFDLPDEGLRQLELDFAAGEFRYLRLTWDDRSSGRVRAPTSVVARLASRESLPPPLRASLPFERRSSEPGKSRYRMRLPGARLPIVALELESDSGNILREGRVTEARLSGNEVVPVLLGSSTLRRASRGDLAASQLRIPIQPPSEAQLDLTVEDGDNPPMEIKAVSAIFAHLPWIYFESEGEKPLTARFGHPGLSAPRYDLEALRESIPKTVTAEARWGEIREGRPEAERLADRPLPGWGAPIDPKTFRFSRPIGVSRPGLNFLSLDAAVLAHSRLADLRITGREGRQVPYLLEKLDEPLAITLPALEKTKAPSGGYSKGASLSFYRIRFPYESLPAARLVLNTQARVFRRSIRLVIEKNPANERQEPWTEQLARETWSHADPETPAQALALSLSSLGTAEALLVVDEGDNSALPIEPPRLLLPSYRLRFFREKEGDLSLVYGRKDLETPRYDLALLAPRLVGAAAEESSLAPEEPVAGEGGRLSSRQLFWGALVAAVVALVFLIGRLVKKNEELL